ncbi:MAG: T9SS type A sorting domain-containing protein [Flavobacteriales bacterium]|nr:T9SS type A sorting domain-containing protein [Flavobacteriales bacterium]
MKNTFKLMLASCLLLSLQGMAQDDQQSHKVRIVTEKNQDGVVTKVDTTIEFTGSKAELDELMKQYEGREGDHDGTKDVRIRKYKDEEGRTHVEKQVEVIVGDGPGEGEDIRIIHKPSDGADGERKEIRIEKSVDENGKTVIHQYVNGEEISPDGSDDGLIEIIEIDPEGDGEDVEVTVDHDVVVDENGNERHEKRVVIIKRISGQDKSELKKKGDVGEAMELEELEAANLQFYPNPNDGRFHLSFALEGKQPVQVRVVDLQGKVVFEEEVAGFSGQYSRDIDISGEGSGVYFLQVLQNKKAMTRKIVINR